MVWSAYMVLVVGCVCVLWFPCCLSGGGGCCEAGEEGYLASVTSCLLCVCCVCVCVCVPIFVSIYIYGWVCVLPLSSGSSLVFCRVLQMNC